MKGSCLTESSCIQIAYFFHISNVNNHTYKDYTIPRMKYILKALLIYIFVRQLAFSQFMNPELSLEIRQKKYLKDRWRDL